MHVGGKTAYLDHGGGMQDDIHGYSMRRGQSLMRKMNGGE